MAAKGWQCYGFDGRLVVSEDSMSCGVKLVQFEFDPEIPSLPFLGVSFDLISAGGFVDYLPSLGGFLDQAAERLKPEGSLLFTAINGHHEESRKNPGHPAWQLHLPEVVSAQLSHRFSQVNLYLVKVIDSRGDEREDEILSKAIESKVVVATPAQVHRLVSATDDIQQCVYMATSPQTSATF
jgi:SAM-dependent methyltransferase